MVLQGRWPTGVTLAKAFCACARHHFERCRTAIVRQLQVELLSIRVTGPRTVEADWRLGGYLVFPWNPRVEPFEGELGCRVAWVSGCHVAFTTGIWFLYVASDLKLHLPSMLPQRRPAPRFERAHSCATGPKV